MTSVRPLFSDSIARRSWNLIVLPADVSTTSSSFGNATGLVIPLLPNLNYAMRGEIAWQTDSLGVRMGFTDPTSCTTAFRWFTCGASASSNSPRFAHADDTGTEALGPYAIGQPIALNLAAQVINGANAGNWQLRFANGATDNVSTITLKAGSWIEWMRVL